MGFNSVENDHQIYISRISSSMRKGREQRLKNAGHFSVLLYVRSTATLETIMIVSYTGCMSETVNTALLYVPYLKDSPNTLISSIIIISLSFAISISWWLSRGIAWQG